MSYTNYCMRSACFTVNWCQYQDQLRLAEEAARQDWNKLLEEGYRETASGILQSPDGKTQVEFS